MGYDQEVQGEVEHRNYGAYGLQDPQELSSHEEPRRCQGDRHCLLWPRGDYDLRHSRTLGACCQVQPELQRRLPRKGHPQDLCPHPADRPHDLSALWLLPPRMLTSKYLEKNRTIEATYFKL